MGHFANAYTAKQKAEHRGHITQSQLYKTWHVICPCGYSGTWRRTREEARQDARIHRYWEIEAS